ncbi:hypothetical protein [Psilogramma increta granulovirus]|uniref:Uncharacterized protein n=1 Tax=Psilogramma increta granulovirus TaxID=2953508 RepID=A0A977TNY0_9BBAC|nr:hypothetical protein [Psilogramma increta granulovirus]
MYACVSLDAMHTLLVKKDAYRIIYAKGGHLVLVEVFSSRKYLDTITFVF